METVKTEKRLNDTEMMTFCSELFEKLSSENMPLSIINSDINGFIKYYSNAAYQKLQFPAIKEKYHTITELFPDESKTILEDRIMKHIRGDKLSAQKCLLQKFDGSKFWAELSTIPEYNRQGKIIGLNLLIYDINEHITSNNRLSDKNNNLLGLMESADDLIWSVDLNGFRLTEFNSNFKKRVFEDYGAEIELGKRSEDIFPADVAPKINDYYKKVVKEGAFREHYKAGSPERTYSLKFNKIFHDNCIIGISVFGKEITEYLKVRGDLHREAYLNKTLLQSMPAFSVVITEDKKTCMINNLLLKVVGRTEEEVINRDYFELFIPAKERSYLEHELERVKVGGVDIHVENNVITKEGKKILTEWRISPYYDEKGRFAYIIGVGNDITKRREIELKSQQYKINLEETINERNKELEKANELLRKEISKQKEMELKVKQALEREKELNDLKSGFIAKVSHEFKTPLTTIYSSTQLLEKFGLEWDSVMYNSQLLRIKEQVCNLNEILEEVLILGKSDLGKRLFRTNKINLKQLCDRIVKDMEILLLPAQEMFYSYEIKEVMFNLDEKNIRYFVLNLLSNSIKYSPMGGKIEFNVKLLNNDLVFTISDEGIGIPEEDQKNLYTPFLRGKNVGDIKGTGLGMSIAKKAVDLNNGRIECFSSVSQGTTFTVTIPVSVPEPRNEDEVKYKKKSADSDERKNKTRIKILVIEDEKDIRENISVLLKSEKYDVIQAADGEEGIKNFKLYKPDLIICDIVMPGIDGYEVLKSINAFKGYAPVPFIYLSAKTEYRELREGMGLGADDYIFKPYEINEILKSVQRCLEKYKLLKSIPSASKYPESIIVRYRGKKIPIATKHILFIQVSGQYTKIFIEGKKQYTMKKALSKWGTLLPDNIFIRIHRSTIANINQIKTIEKISNNSYKVYLINSDHTLELSRRYYKNMKKHTLA
jgi:PAS domain S-box-containing protein